jgi:hypothetical protein
MAEILTPRCPLCGELPELIVGISQAFCGNEDCTLFMWTPTKSLDDNLLDAGMIHLPQATEGTDDD